MSVKRLFFFFGTATITCRACKNNSNMYLRSKHAHRLQREIDSNPFGLWKQRRRLEYFLDCL